ncbi:hypothetical protein NDA16_003369 [Ustilago loliicola]|nr:hypothetical protein NDA16_003369 [Ustilago loliicola]
MDPPSSGGDGSGGRSNSVNSMAFCHECGIEIRPLMTPDPTCPRCNGQFVEIIDQNSAQGFQEQANHPFAAVHGDPFPGFQFHTAPLPARGGTAAPPLSFVQGAGSPLPQGLGGLLMAMAGGGRRPSSGADGSSRSPVYHESQAHPPASAANDGDSQRRSSESQTNTRSGSTSFGPFGLQWNVQYGSGGGDPYQRAAQHQAENQRYHQPPTLSNFLRFAFGSGTTDDQPSRNRQGDHDEYFHDDGMGGAGGAADGRHYNHDNRGRYHQPSQSLENESNRRPSAGGANSDLPPELSALRNLFTGLFGEPGAQGMGGGGSLLNFLAAGAQVGDGGGPRGQWGDYVLGQQGLDDIISQLMEQTQGSNAPPPATDDVIDKLERFTLADKERIEKAKNQDCPTGSSRFSTRQLAQSTEPLHIVL